MGGRFVVAMALGELTWTLPAAPMWTLSLTTDRKVKRKKSPAETRNIGKLTLAMIRNAAATGLGSRAMGSLRDVIYSLPSAAATPMPVITDEYAAIAVEGYELVLTQLRALGIIGAIGNQDFSGMTKGGGDKGTGPASAGQIIANTGLKLALRTADPRDTWDLFRALAGEGDDVASL